MTDMLKSSRDEDQRRQTEAQFYSVQQQLDELRRQLRENLARQQWFEELYKQNEGKVSQIQAAQDRLAQDVAQALHARQIDEARVKAQISELAQRVESPDKQLREMRAQIQELSDSRKNDRDVDVASQRQIDDLQKQIRDIVSQLGVVSNAQKQLRDVIQELDSALGEVRQEGLHIAELQRLEEQRLRRQGVELQGLFEALKQQFNEVATRSLRVDDVRHQLTERIEAIEEMIGTARADDTTIRTDIERIEKGTTEQYVTQQERLEMIRSQLDSQLGELRQINDQRVDRIMNRFVGIDERIRAAEQALSELPSRFDALERKDEVISGEADTIEEWLVMRQLTALEAVLDDVRKRRAERATALKTGKIGPSLQDMANAQADPNPGSVYNPAGLIKSVRDARPPSRSNDEE